MTETRPDWAAIDATHDPARRSFVESAADPATDFPIQNLPFCVFRPADGRPRIGVAIGNRLLDCSGLGPAGLVASGTAELLGRPSLNPLMAAGRPVWRSLRHRLSYLLSTEAAAAERKAVEALLHARADVVLLMPAAIADYTDFYASAQHATNVGKQFRPDNPLLPNYKWIPIGYHGRASSIRVSGGAFPRPNGQTKPADAAAPSFGPCRQLDYEAELGFFVGPGNASGEPVPIGRAPERLFGVTLLNDWSARDMQAWEYQPLGPFLAKNFATTISPFIVTMEALAPFRVPALARPAGDPGPLPYLTDAADQAHGGLGLTVTMLIRSAAMQEKGMEPHAIATVDYRAMYWTPAQFLAHHTSNGCNLQPGDLFGSGTISSDDERAVGSLLELTRRGAAPIVLPTGESRAFLADGDEVTLVGRAAREGFVAVGFGRCTGTVAPAVPIS